MRQAGRGVLGSALTPPNRSVVALPVVPDVLHVVAVLQHVDELLHILQIALIGETYC